MVEYLFITQGAQAGSPARLELGVAVMLVVSALQLGLEREDQKLKVFLSCTENFRPGLAYVRHCLTPPNPHTQRIGVKSESSPSAIVDLGSNCFKSPWAQPRPTAVSLAYLTQTWKNKRNPASPQAGHYSLSNVLALLN